MGLSQRLELKQGQSLVMTPQLMQAIKLLQLSNVDLLAYVDAELERNPLLERADDERPDVGHDVDPPEQADAGNGAGDGADDTRDWFERDAPPNGEAVSATFDTDIANVYPDEPAALQAPAAFSAESWASRSGSGSGEDVSLESFVAHEATLRERLTDQFLVAVADPVLRFVAADLIDSVDDAGYLRADLDEVAERLGVDRRVVERTLAALQSLEPAGVCARDLAECLRLQLEDRNRFDPAMARLLANMDLLARRDLAALKRVCGVDDEDLAEMMREILALDPKPGLVYGRASLQPVVPDVLVSASSDGGWAIELNAETLPRVLVNGSYQARVARGARGAADRSYIAECLQTANWLVKSLDQRAKTILKVSAEIVRQQDGFLTQGVSRLRPLNLRTIADAIGMHESTVSRVTSNKYMATPRGIFELKYFFTSSIAASDGGEAFSAESVRHRIRQIIDAENQDDVLSDDAIVKRLRDAGGIDIARRTVAKYREAMRIASSVQRRRQKQALTPA